MGDRYYLSVKCPTCGYVDENVYFAPTCGIISHRCENCDEEIDLCKLTGISYEDASNIDVMREIFNTHEEEYKKEK